jgi:methylated-DNA-[protein]-cysteine S-methyltransferase
VRPVVCRVPGYLDADASRSFSDVTVIRLVTAHVLVQALKSETVRFEHTRYKVPGWGVGELWTANGVVLAHDFDFVADSGVGVRDSTGGDWPADAASCARNRPTAAPLEGAQGPPSGTVPSISAQVGDAFVSDRQQDTDRSPTLSADELVARFAAFFEGQSMSFGDVLLDLSWTTPFQRAVADSLRVIPRGEVVSYRDLALLAGHPGAQRAAGTFCSRNRFMLLLPCHRVVGADGIGGYGSAGVAVKRRLLALEGVLL